MGAELSFYWWFSFHSTDNSTPILMILFCLSRMISRNWRMPVLILLLLYTRSNDSTLILLVILLMILLPLYWWFSLVPRPLGGRDLGTRLLMILLPFYSHSAPILLMILLPSYWWLYFHSTDNSIGYSTPVLLIILLPYFFKHILSTREIMYIIQEP